MAIERKAVPELLDTPFWVHVWGVVEKIWLK
jgi:hypothetical protein